MNADLPKSDPLAHESRVTKFFDVAGGIAGMGCVLTSIILFVALPGYQNKAVVFVVALLLLGFGLAAGLSRNFRKIRIAVGLLFVVFFALSIAAAMVLSRG